MRQLVNLALDDPNIIKALTLNILTSGYDMDEGSESLAIIYRIYYRLLKTNLNPNARLKNIILVAQHELCLYYLQSYTISPFIIGLSLVWDFW